MPIKDFHKQILENLSTAVVLLDSSLTVEYANPAAEMLLQASLRRLSQVSVSEWFSPEQNGIDDLQSCFETGHPYTRREARLVTQAGSALTVDYSINPVFWSTGRQLLIEIEARDRLMRIEREEDLLTQHDTARSLVRGMAHEIKNPLGGIRGAAQLLERELPDLALHDYTRVIIEEADRLRNLVDRLLGPRTLPKLEDVNIHAILERVCQLIEAETKGSVVLERDYDPSIPEFTGDAEQLIQAVLNILRNSMQAMQSAGTAEPTIKIKTRAFRQITLGAEKHRLVCSVEIVDNGPGIPDEILSKIFYPMVSGRAEGTGLGLSIAQSIINQHQGLIECDTRPGETKFQLFIPLEISHESVR
ncbi:nitrogen regulation protein NR(II) [Neptuniibacter caesariensis]|uniref:Sensory histidine kinase/phosphatase NtrB n=1 Tax=Neptuniibacter caesariensis TaxID=207954 RepID=A0A7U8GQ72_NEPCE|nr:nitrogen regulation protein NR(II) [Neptuniibacter caesariensis]EAR60027.1 Signal transduction histidine kinase, nitrogen specific, NtrB [Neptuniibacter caesariensis]